MASNPLNTLSRCERQIMDSLYRLGSATAADILQALGGSSTDSTVRTQLRVLEGKGHVRHQVDGHRFVYLPVVPASVAQKAVLRHLIETFFKGSVEEIVAALIGRGSNRLADDQLHRIAEMVAEARAPDRN